MEGNNLHDPWSTPLIRAKATALNIQNAASTLNPYLWQFLGDSSMSSRSLNRGTTCEGDEHNPRAFRTLKVVFRTLRGCFLANQGVLCGLCKQFPSTSSSLFKTGHTTRVSSSINRGFSLLRKSQLHFSLFSFSIFLL